MTIKFNLIAAVCENMGIGKNNTLPWRLKTEMEYFTRMTTTTSDKNKKNVVIMGRKSWDSIPTKFKPLANRFNFVLSRSELDLSSFENTFSFTSLEKAMEKLNDPAFKNLYEAVWVIGGSHIYKESMKSKNFFRLYLTEIKKNYDCDTFLPPIDKEKLKEIVDEPEVPQGIQEENNVQFEYKVYENTEFRE